MISNSFRLALFEIQKRSLNTYAGWMWSLLNPLAQMGLLYFIMTHVFKSDIENIVLWLIGGLTTWIVMQGSIVRSCSSLVSRRALMQNNNISPALLVGADVISELLILAPFFVLGIVAAFMSGTNSANLILIPFVLLLILAFTFGIGLTLATVTPIFRDLPHLVGLALQVAFWLTPIAYAKTTMTGFARIIVHINPFTYFIELTQAIFLARPITWPAVVIPLGISLTAVALGLMTSVKMGKQMVISL